MPLRLLTFPQTSQIKVIQQNYQITNIFSLRSYQIQRPRNGFYQLVNPKPQTNE